MSSVETEAPAHQFDVVDNPIIEDADALMAPEVDQDEQDEVEAIEEAVANSKNPPAQPIVLDTERHQELMEIMMLVDQASNRAKPEFDAQRLGCSYEEEEELIRMPIAEKPKDYMKDPNGNRMIIKDIFVDNFKSYVGRHQLGPLHKNLTMIIGPNGSGKSNVIDALLFVFGYKCSKIRTPKLIGAINTDGDHESALVEVHFQEIKDVSEEKYIVNVDHSLIIARSVHKDGSSHYFLNHQKTTYGDIKDLLERFGLDLLHNRFLILQGEVEQISQMKPISQNGNDDGMLEYIESLVGTDRYKIPIEKISHRCRMLEWHTSSTAAAYRRYKNLTEKFEKMCYGGIQYINAMNNKNLIRGLKAKADLFEHNQSLPEAEKAMKLREDELHDNREKLIDQKAIVKEIEEKQRKAAEEASRLADERLEIIDQQAEWERTDIELRRNLKNANHGIKDIVQRRADIEEKVKDEEQKPEKLRLNLEKMEQELEQLRKCQQECETVYRTNLAKYDAKADIEKKRVEDFNRNGAAHEQKAMEMQLELDVHEAKLKDMVVIDVQEEQRLDDMKEKMEQTISALRNAEERFASKKAEQAQKIKAFDVERVRIENLEGEIDTRKAEVADIERKIEDYESNMASSKYRHEATIRMHKLKQEGKFSFFQGRLGDMVSVPKKLDEVISTLFSGMCEMHIVQTREESQRAVEILNENKIPRTSFMYLNHVLYEEKFPNLNLAPEMFPAPRLIDQVMCPNEALRRVVYRSLHDTLIVKDLRTAMGLDKKFRGQFRYATHDCSILDRNGAVTGGGPKFSGSIRVGTAASMAAEAAFDLEGNKQIIMRTDMEIANLRRTLDRAMTIYETKENELKEMAKDLRFIEEEVENLRKLVETLSVDVTELERNLRRTDRIECTEEELLEKRQLVTRLRHKIQSEKEIAKTAILSRDTAETKIEKMFTELVGKHRDKLSKQNERIALFEETIAKDRATLEGHPKLIAELKRKRDELKNRFEADYAEVHELSNREKGEHSEREADLRRQLKEVEEKIRLINIESCNLAEERSKKDKKVQELQDLYTEASNLFENTRACAEMIQCNRERCLQILREVEENWYDPEKLDPGTKFIRPDDPDLMVKINQNYLMLPQEVVDKIEYIYKDLYDDHPPGPSSKQVLTQLVNKCGDLDKALEEFRVKGDEKGITHYCVMAALKANEETKLYKNSSNLKRHRRRMFELKSGRLDEFQEALTFLGTTTQMLYQMITNGGDASLKFVEEGRSLDPFAGGVKFQVRPAKKSWKLIENLSGGEKTLASLCFVFAMHHFRATPLYVMDEIDAALDLNNVKLIANYIKFSERTRRAQFIIVSLRNQMFEVGNRLIGIYKTDGSTKHIVVAPENVERLCAAPAKLLADTIREMFGKDKEKQDDEALTRQMGQVAIEPRKSNKKKLMPTLLKREYDDSDDEDEPTMKRSKPTIPPASLAQPCAAKDDTDDDDDEDDFEDEAPVKKPKKKVAEEFNRDSDASERSTPEVVPPPKEVKKGSWRQRSRRN